MDRPNPEPLAPAQESQEESSFKARIASPAFWLTFLVMAAVWLVLTGKFDLFHLSLGLISCLLVTYFSSDLLFDKPLSGTRATIAFRFMAYLPWLFYQIVLANWHVLKLCFSPRMTEKLDPRLVIFESSLKSELSLVTLANSITLTPGTITVRVTVDGEFIVHAIDSISADPDALKKMEAKVAKAFKEEA